LENNLTQLKQGIVIFPVALFTSKIWSPTLKEVHRLTVFENRLLEKIFRPKRKEVTEGWIKKDMLRTCIDLLHTKYQWGYKIKLDGMGGACGW
jgi:hypothetical protein